MNDKAFDVLLKKDRYQVFLLACPASIPVNFALHPWFVVNKKGTLSRWEVFCNPEVDWFLRWGHLHQDLYPPFQGTAMFFFSKKHVWREVRVLGVIEGDEGSLAHRMAEFIEASPETYSSCHRYSLTGPNSNTYAQWVLDRFPDCGLRLPWNSFGKNYTMKETS